MATTYPKINSFTYHGKQINSINGKPIRYVHDKRAGMDNTYEMVYVVQLATPQNVTANGTTVSWDEVENATSYAVLADGSEIGTVENESGETWLLNENPNPSTLPNTSINFTSNEMSFSSIRYSSSPGNPAAILYGDTYAWSTGVWINEAFRTVTFETAPTGDLLTWLQTNAVKQ